MFLSFIMVINANATSEATRRLNQGQGLGNFGSSKNNLKSDYDDLFGDGGDYNTATKMGGGAVNSSIGGANYGL